MPVKFSQINPSTIVRAARAAGSQPHLASGFQGCCKIATLHARSESSGECRLENSRVKGEGGSK
jgi:hypothetical protein